MKVRIYHDGMKRSIHVMKSLAEGIGSSATVLQEDARVAKSRQYDSLTDLVMFYGYSKVLRDVGEEYKARGGKYVVWDLGYWARKDEHDPMQGYHRFAVNVYHPTGFEVAGTYRDDRLGLLPKVKGNLWDQKGHILLAGMSEKSAGVYGLGPEEWERFAAIRLLKITRRPIVYRPKPSWLHSGQIPGAKKSDPGTSLKDDLTGCALVVTHHSNVAMDALRYGIPVHCVTGPWVGFSTPIRDYGGSLSVLEPPEPLLVQKLLCALSYHQWHTKEMRSGAWWKFFRRHYMEGHRG